MPTNPQTSGTPEPDSDPNAPQSASPASVGENPEHMIPKKRLDEVLDQNRKLQERLQAIESAARQREQQALAEQGKFKDLYDQASARIKELEPLTDIVKGYEGTLQDMFDAQMKAIPEAMRSLVPTDLPLLARLKWISTNQKLLAKPQPFEIGEGRRGGTSGSGVDTSALTEEQLRIAASFGMTPEEYIKFL